MSRDQDKKFVLAKLMSAVLSTKNISQLEAILKNPDYTFEVFSNDKLVPVLPYAFDIYMDEDCQLASEAYPIIEKIAEANKTDDMLLQAELGDTTIIHKVLLSGNKHLYRVLKITPALIGRAKYEGENILHTLIMFYEEMDQWVRNIILESVSADLLLEQSILGDSPLYRMVFNNKLELLKLVRQRFSAEDWESLVTIDKQLTQFGEENIEVLFKNQFAAIQFDNLTKAISDIFETMQLQELLHIEVAYQEYLAKLFRLLVANNIPNKKNKTKIKNLLELLVKHYVISISDMVYEGRPLIHYLLNSDEKLSYLVDIYKAMGGSIDVKDGFGKSILQVAIAERNIQLIPHLIKVYKFKFDLLEKAEILSLLNIFYPKGSQEKVANSSVVLKQLITLLDDDVYGVFVQRIIQRCDQQMLDLVRGASVDKWQQWLVNNQDSQMPLLLESYGRSKVKKAKSKSKFTTKLIDEFKPFNDVSFKLLLQNRHGEFLVPDYITISRAQLIKEENDLEAAQWLLGMFAVKIPREVRTIFDEMVVVKEPVQEVAPVTMGVSIPNDAEKNSPIVVIDGKEHHFLTKDNPASMEVSQLSTGTKKKRRPKKKKSALEPAQIDAAKLNGKKHVSFEPINPEEMVAPTAQPKTETEAAKPRQESVVKDAAVYSSSSSPALFSTQGDIEKRLKQVEEKLAKEEARRLSLEQQLEDQKLRQDQTQQQVAEQGQQQASTEDQVVQTQQRVTYQEQHQAFLAQHQMIMHAGVFHAHQRLAAQELRQDMQATMMPVVMGNPYAFMTQQQFPVNQMAPQAIFPPAYPRFGYQ